MNNQNTSQIMFARYCDAIRDIMASLSRVTNNASYTAGCLKLESGDDADLLFGELCQLMQQTEGLYKKLQEQFEKLVFTPQKRTKLP